MCYHVFVIDAHKRQPVDHQIHAQPQGFELFQDKAEAGDDGEWLNKVSVPYEAAPLYAPQGVEMGGGGSPQN